VLSVAVSICTVAIVSIALCGNDDWRSRLGGHGHDVKGRPLALSHQRSDSHATWDSWDVDSKSSSWVRSFWHRSTDDR
jgi:hypothetical protein